MEKVVDFDRHAKRRMKWRKISEEEVRKVLTEPDNTELTRKGRKNAYKTVGSRRIKVTYKEFPDSILVISAVEKI